MTAEPVGADRLGLSAVELLSTTRAVRRRLDLERPVDDAAVEACIRLAQQAPTGSNTQAAHFVVVREPRLKRGLAELYRRGRSVYRELPYAIPNFAYAGEQEAAIPKLLADGAHLADVLERVPVLVVPCVAYRPASEDVLAQALVWGAVLPAVWSFCLAAREHGLGTCWTTMHLAHEVEAAELLGIPHAEVMQVALLPLAHTMGTDFRPATRLPPSSVLHRDGW